VIPTACSREHRSCARVISVLSPSPVCVCVPVTVDVTSFCRAATSASLTADTSAWTSDCKIWPSRPTSFLTTEPGADDAITLKPWMDLSRYSSFSSKRSVRMSSALSALTQHMQHTGVRRPVRTPQNQAEGERTCFAVPVHAEEGRKSPEAKIDTAHNASPVRTKSPARSGYRPTYFGSSDRASCLHFGPAFETSSMAWNSEAFWRYRLSRGISERGDPAHRSLHTSRGARCGHDGCTRAKALRIARSAHSERCRDRWLTPRRTHQRPP
jgi:hypothetical protein